MIYFGALSDAEAQGIQNAINTPKNPNISFVGVTKFGASTHYQFLELWLLHWVCMSWGLHQLLGRIKYAELLILNRAVDPTSKIGVFEWAPKTACPAFLGVPSSADVDFEKYRDLDRLSKKQDEIMTYLYHALESRGLCNDSTFLYDMTATFMEGAKCLIAGYGHSPGGKAGHKQIKIALAVTRDGYPFYWEVLNGKTGEKTTIKHMVLQLKKLFGIKSCTFVFDRGMVSEGDFKIIESAGCTYLGAIVSDTLRSEQFPGLAQLANIDLDRCRKLAFDLAEAEDLTKVNIPEEPDGFSIHEKARVFYRTYKRCKIRYIAIFNPELCVTRKENRNQLIEKAKAEIRELNSELSEAAKDRKPGPVETKVKDILSDLELKGVYEPVIDNVTIQTSPGPEKGSKSMSSFRVKLAVNQEKLSLIEAYDGLYCLYTDLSEEILL